MRLLNINCFVEAYYSGATYEENILIPADTFDSLLEKIRNKIRDLDIFVGELDGKHSETIATIEEDGIQYIEEDGIESCNIATTCDGDNMYYELEEIFEYNGIHLDEEIKRASEYINTIDTYVTKEFRIKKSQVPSVLKFIESLNV